MGNDTAFSMQVQRLPRFRLSRLANVLRQVPVSEDVARDRNAELGAGVRATGIGAAPLARRERLAGPDLLKAFRTDGSRRVRVVAPGE